MLRSEEEQSTGNLKLVKLMNRKAVLYQLKQHQQLSRAGLAKQTGLSRPCISSLVDEMIVEGMIYETGMGKSSGGRKPILLEANWQAYTVIGAVMSSVGMRLGLADLKGELLNECHVSLSSSQSTVEVVHAFGQAIDHLLEEAQQPRSQLLGLGLGLPGITECLSGSLSHAPSASWLGSELKQEIENQLGLKAIVDNDVNLMALGEFYRGVGQAVTNLVYVYVGTGVGAGIIINGQIYRGSKHAAGEIGYLVVGAATHRHPQAYGTFEQNYSLVGLRKRVQSWQPDISGNEHLTKDLISLVRKGHPEAQSLYDEIIQHWAYGLVNVISVLDPELLVVSGELLDLDEPGLDDLRTLILQLVPMSPVLTRAQLGTQAGLFGAIHSALASFEPDLASSS